MSDDFWEYHVPKPGDKYEQPNAAFWRDKRGYWRWRVLDGGTMAQFALGLSHEGFASKAEAKANMIDLANAILQCRVFAPEPEPEKVGAVVVNLQAAKDELDKNRDKQ